MRSITAAAIAIVLLGAAPAAAQTVPALHPPAHIDVSGQGSVDRSPDRVVVSFSIVTNDDDATRATSANNTLYNALTAKLHALGLDAPAVKTTGYSLGYNPRPAEPNPQFQQRYGYVVSRSVAVTSDRTEQAGAIVDAGVSAGITNVGGISFGLRDGKAVYREALAAAVADADSQARAIAAAAHVRIVRVLSLSAGGYAPVSGGAPRFAAMVAAPPVPTDVQPSSLSVTASVAVSFEIAP
jgi:uncharacterized protein YggE